MEKRYSEYIGALITHFRKIHRGEAITVTDKKHQHWSTVEGYPICCDKTLYNIQKGKMDCDIDAIIFIVGKFGYKYYEDSEDGMLFFNKLFEKIDDYRINNCSQMNCLRKEIENCCYKDYFLFNVYSELAKCIIDFYSDNTIKNYIAFHECKYEKNIFTENMQKYVDILDCYFFLFIENNFYRVNQIVGMDSVPIIDKNFLFAGQASTEDALEVQMGLLRKEIDKMPQGNKEHYNWLIVTIIKTAALALGKDVDMEEYHNVTIREVLNTEKRFSYSGLQRIFNKRNPMLNNTFWRIMGKIIEDPEAKNCNQAIRKVIKKYYMD